MQDGRSWVSRLRTVESGVDNIWAMQWNWNQLLEDDRSICGRETLWWKLYSELMIRIIDWIGMSWMKLALLIWQYDTLNCGLLEHTPCILTATSMQSWWTSSQRGLRSNSCSTDVPFVIYANEVWHGASNCHGVVKDPCSLEYPRGRLKHMLQK